MSIIKHILNRDSAEQVDVSDITKLIESKTEEFLYLDYERIPERHIKLDGLAEHISGFLNTSGGLVLFGVAEKEEDNRHIPDCITWTSLDKETVENVLFQKVHPWDKDIQIHPLQNPENDSERIFLISVPKSRNPPHMVNYRYYMRLNFQTRPMGHEQVLSMFRQSYLQKKELVWTVYGPLYNEIAANYNVRWIRPWSLGKYNQILREGRFLLSQDVDFAMELDKFYNRIEKWNKAVEVSRFRVTKIINKVAGSFFKKKLHSAPDQSAMKMDIQAESTSQLPHIDEAILNGRDPLDFWKQQNPFARIVDVKIKLQIEDEQGRRDFTIEEEKFNDFLKEVALAVNEDDLITYIRKEFQEMQAFCETFLLDELRSRM